MSPFKKLAISFMSIFIVKKTIPTEKTNCMASMPKSTSFVMGAVRSQPKLLSVKYAAFSLSMYFAIKFLFSTAFTAFSIVSVSITVTAYVVNSVVSSVKMSVASIFFTPRFFQFKLFFRHEKFSCINEKLNQSRDRRDRKNNRDCENK